METNAKHVSNVSPGDPIASATQPDPEQNLDLDVDIPRLEQADSPSFASQAVDIPNNNPFQELKGPQWVFDLTKQDHLLGETGADEDELSRTSQPPQPAAGLLRFLNSDAA